MIEKNDILNGLTTSILGKSIYTFSSIDSTNSFAKSLPKEEAPHGTLLITELQTNGRGRMQRKWDAEEGKNLLFSLILYPEFGKEKIALLPFAGALAVCDGVEATLPLLPECKWPNDVLVHNKKICGMLLETSAQSGEKEKIIMGIGINVNQETFPEEIRLKASSLKNEIGKEVNRILLLQNILQAFEFRYAQLSEYPSRLLLRDWKTKTTMLGRRVTIMQPDFSFEAKALDLSEDGSLLVELNDGTQKNIYAGDVSLQENYSPGTHH